MTKAEKKKLAAARIYLRRENKKWPDDMICIPKKDWDPKTRDHPKGPVKAWRSNRYLAHLYHDRGFVRLSINRADMTPAGKWDDGLTWDEMMAVKDECGFGECWAVEVYPPNSEVVNVANMRHLWLFTEAPAYGWRKERTKEKT